MGGREDDVKGVPGGHRGNVGNPDPGHEQAADGQPSVGRWAGWTDELIDRLISFWESGATSGAIAREMGTTRGSVMGKVHRLIDAGTLRHRSPEAASAAALRRQNATRPALHARPVLAASGPAPVRSGATVSAAPDRNDIPGGGERPARGSISRGAAKPHRPSPAPVKPVIAAPEASPLPKPVARPAAAASPAAEIITVEPVEPADPGRKSRAPGKPIPKPDAHRVPQSTIDAVMGSSSRRCRWPIGDPFDSGFRFCNGPLCGRGSYCEAHAEQAFTVPTPSTGRGFRLPTRKA